MIIGFLLSFVVYYAILPVKSPKLVKTITASTIIIGLLFAPYLYVDIMEVQNVGSRFYFMFGIIGKFLKTISILWHSTRRCNKLGVDLLCILFSSIRNEF